MARVSFTADFKIRVTRSAFWALVALTSAAGCQGTIQVGIEQTATPDEAITATMAALAAENRRLATQVAAQGAVVPSALELGQLAYVQGGDIWILAVLDEAVRPRRLTTDGRNLEPRWSPSGQWLAYNRQTQLPSSEAPIDTPGFSISVLQRQVRLIRADGAGEHLLNQGLAVEAWAWSPVEDRLAYTTAAGGLSTVDADGTDLVTLIPESVTTTPGEQQVGRIRWSPDGGWIAYELRIQPANRFLVYQGLWKIPSGGGAARELYNADIPTKSEAALVGWSPRGAEVLFLQSDRPPSSPVEAGQLYAVQAGADAPEASINRISTDTILAYPDFVAPAPISPSGATQTMVAFVAGDGPGTWSNKYIWSAGQRITGDDLAVISPAWSPDGRRLAFSAMPEQGQAGAVELLQRRIWVANAYGAAQLRRLTDAGGYRDERPHWSAGGDYLLFVRMDPRGRASLWIIPSSGGLARQVVGELTPAPDPLGFDGHVDWDAYFHWWRGS